MELIPGQWDDTLRVTAIATLDKVLACLYRVDEAWRLVEPADRVTYTVQDLKQALPTAGQNAMAFKAASLYLREKHPELTERQADVLVQARYDYLDENNRIEK